MKTILAFSTLFVLTTCYSPAQTRYTYSFHVPKPEVAVETTAPFDAPEVCFALPGEAFSEKKNDPGYEAYKKGYNLVLDEEWEGAVKQLRAMLSKYPKSQYADDASYWIAYAFKSMGDDSKAKEQYKIFIKTYPKSNYYDDAVADLDELDAMFVISTSGDSQHVIIGRSAGRGYSYSTGTGATTYNLATDKVRSAQAMSRYQLGGVRGSAPMAVTVPARTPFPPRKIDKETQLKLDVLYALSDKKDDEKAYSALKDIAIDMKENKTLRLAAMEELMDFKKYDPLQVYIEIAKRDTNEEIQNLAIDHIGSLSGNKNRSVETLSELFKAIPKYRNSQLHTVLSSIAEIGNDKAVEFLGEVARKNDNYDLRHDAVYYLGSIGNDKARSMLLEILREKK